MNWPSRNIQANAHKKKKCNKPATMPQTTLWFVWPIPQTKSTSAISRHTQRFLWIVVLSDCKRHRRVNRKIKKYRCRTSAIYDCWTIDSHLYITFNPRNNWNVRMARTRQTTEMMQPIYVIICNATWWAMSNLTACTSIRTAKFVRWLHSHTVWVSLVFCIWHPSSDQALREIRCRVLWFALFTFFWLFSGLHKRCVKIRGREFSGRFESRFVSLKNFRSYAILRRRDFSCAARMQVYLEGLLLG